MVSRDPVGALPLLIPAFQDSDARATGLLLANSMRQSILFAQSQARPTGPQTYGEQGTDVVLYRSIYQPGLTSIARMYKRLPRHARAVGANIRFQVSFDGDPIDGYVYHRITVASDVGITTQDEVTSIPFFPGFNAGTDFAETDRGITGLFGVYDLETQEARCVVDLFDELPLGIDNDLLITVEAYAVSSATRDVAVDSSSRTSDVVTANVERGHDFVAGELIWTEGFDANIPQGSPLPIDSVTDATITWTQEGDDNGSFDGTTIHSVAGAPLWYRPSIVSAWWET